MAAPAATSIAVLSAKGLSGTSYTTAAIGVADSGAGAYAVLLAGQGGTNVISSVTDSAGNTYTAIPGTNATSGGNAGTWIFLSGSNPHPLLTTTTFTVVNSLSVGRYVLHVFKIDVVPAVVAGTGAFGFSTSSTAIAVTSGTPSVSGDYLWLAVTGWQSTGQTLTISSTGYTLIPTGTAVEGTTGGSATTNISAKVGYKQVLGSAAAQNFNGTQSAFVTWGNSIAALTVGAATVAPITPAAGAKAAATAVVSTPAFLSSPGAVGAGGPAYAKTVLADSPSGYWRLDETAGTSFVDSSGNGYTGAAYSAGSMTLAQPGLISADPDTCVNFNEGCFRVGGLTPFVPGSAITVEAWSVRVTPNQYCAWVKSDMSNAGPIVSVNDDGSVGWQAGPSQAVSWPSGTVPVNTPVYMAITYDDSTLTSELFVNGASQGTRTFGAGYGYSSSGSGVSTSPIHIAGDVGNGAWNWQGQFDEAAVYPRVLSAATIAKHYAAGRTYDQIVMADGPASYWPLNDATGTAAADVAGSAPGTYVGGITLGVPGIGDGDTAVALDGAASTVISMASFGSTQGSITWEVWGYLTPPSLSGYGALLTRTVGNGGAPYDWYVVSNAGSVDFYINGNGFLSATGVVPSNAWTHFVFTYDGTSHQIRVYVNGQQVISDPGNYTAPADGAKPLLFGNRDDQATAFKGSAAKAAVYRHVLTPAQVPVHYAAGTTPLAPAQPIVAAQAATAATATVTIPAPAAFLTPSAQAAAQAIASVVAQQKLTLTAGTAAAATTLISAPTKLTPAAGSATQATIVLSAPTTLSVTAGAAAQAIALVTTPVGLTASAGTTSQALAFVGIPVPLVINAGAATAATARTTPLIVCAANATTSAACVVVATTILTLSASCASQAVMAVTAGGKLTPSAGATTVATGVLTAPIVLQISAQATSQAIAPLTAPTRLTATAQATSSATAVLTAQLTLHAQATTSATAIVVAVAQIVLTAQATTQATSGIQVPGVAFLTLNGAAATQATAALSASGKVTASAGSSTSALSLVTAQARLTATAAAATQAINTVTAVAGAPLSVTARCTTSAVAAVTAPVALTPLSTSTSSATATATATSLLTAVASSTTAASAELNAAAVLTLDASSVSNATAALAPLLVGFSSCTTSARVTLVAHGVVDILRVDVVESVAGLSWTATVATLGISETQSNLLITEEEQTDLLITAEEQTDLLITEED